MRRSAGGGVFLSQQEEMIETIDMPVAGSKEERYQSLYPQLKAMTEGEPDFIANMANVTAALKEAFGFFWIGFYRVVEETLVLGPFQGPIACTRIAYGRGVCGTAWKERRTVVVPDVERFPGHIACNPQSRSEIVVPVFRGDKVVALLDLDSDHLNGFDMVDAAWLEKISRLL